MRLNEYEVSWLAKLTPRQVRRIRALGAEGKLTYAQIAKKYKVSQPTITNILTRKTYKKVA